MKENNQNIYQRYLENSVYTDVGNYKDFVLSLPEDIPAIGMLICDQITHPSMYFTEPSSYLEEAYYGKFGCNDCGYFAFGQNGVYKKQGCNQKNYSILPAGFRVI